jgi:hypothetical protein
MQHQKFLSNSNLLKEHLDVKFLYLRKVFQIKIHYLKLNFLNIFFLKKHFNNNKSIWNLYEIPIIFFAKKTISGFLVKNFISRRPPSHPAPESCIGLEFEGGGCASKALAVGCEQTQF